MKKNQLLIVLLFLTNLCYSQGNPMEEFFFRSGKINVVIAVAAVILAGIFIYLFRMEKKIKKMEDQIKSDSNRS